MKSRTILFVCTSLLAIFFMVRCDQDSQKSKANPEVADAENALSPGEHFAPVNGITLHYYVAGSGPVCLVPSPGWGISVDYLYKSWTSLEKHFTMVFYDTRMSGKSTGPEDSTKYTSNEFMNDMDSLRVYLGQQKVWIAGHSSGGFQVLNYGIHHSDNLYGIIAVDAGAGTDSLSEAVHQKAIMKRKGQPYFEKIYNIFTHKDTTHYTLAEELKITLPFYFHDTLKIKDFPNDNSQASDKTLHYTAASHFNTEYLFPELNKITVPELVVVGDDDFVCPKISQSDRIVRNIPNSTEIVIKGAGHFPWIEQPEQFFLECGNWLQEQKLEKQN